MKRTFDLWTGVFLLLELVLYYFILTASGTVLVACEFGAIVLCFLYALLRTGRNDPLPVAALACTVGADFFLVVCEPMQQLGGMVFFLAAQSLYAVKLHRVDAARVWWIVRGAAATLAVCSALIVLRDRADALSLVSMAYYAMLVVNILASARDIRTEPLMFAGFILFLLCDTVIGLQVAAGGYLPIASDTWLYRLLFPDFNLAWLFYLPSQVLLALSGQRKAVAD